MKKVDSSKMKIKINEEELSALRKRKSNGRRR